MRRATPPVVVALLTVLLPAAAPAAEPPTTPQVRLLSPGRGPLKPLRFHATAGQRGHVGLVMNMTIGMSMAGQQGTPTPTPEMRSGFDYVVTEVTPAGDIHSTFEFTTAEVVAQPSAPAPVVQAMREALAGMRGLKGRSVVNNRGAVLEADVQVPEQARPELKQLIDGVRQSMRQMSSPFPEEPVGIGARWETTTRLTQNDVTITQVATSELTSLAGDQGLLAITLAQSADPQRMVPPNLPPTARVDLLSMASKGAGETRFDLARAAPVSARVKLSMQMAMRIQVAQEKPQEMTMTMDISTSLSTTAIK